MKIFVDAGHNFSGSDTGAEGYGLREQDVTFYIAERLKDLLISAGHEVKMSREKLTDNLGSSLSDSLNTRVNMANRLGMHLFISIHCNAYNGVARGTETLVYSFGSQAAEYAERI
ncbi:MAG: N-acetylmuramoyl-L-alanine amidase, partial [Clostridia bacterium]|nr:N-acetylmuramoyl-L-alanine amidase [Clostridia bacterium]